METQVAEASRTDSAMTVAATPTLPKQETVMGALEKMKGQFAMVLPKHITPERMIRVALTACQNNPKLLQADRKSFFGAVMRSAQLGLEPDGVLGQAYLIPFNKSYKDETGKWQKRLEVQFIPGYKGLIDLARRSGDVTNIIAKEVCEKDTFKIAWHESPPFFHEQPVSGDRGEVIGFWALANFKEGGFHWDYMTKTEVEAVRNQSSGWQTAVEFKKTSDSPWDKHFIEMGKKTLIRRIAKYLPMSVQKAALMEDLQDSKVEFHENDFGEIVIDGESNAVENEGTHDNEPPKGNKGIKETLKKKKASDAGADPETGELPADKKVIPDPEQRETQSVTLDKAKPQEEQKPPLLDTLDQVKSAATVLILAIEAAPPALKNSLFIQMYGTSIVEALRNHGQGILIGKIKKAGVNLPE